MYDEETGLYYLRSRYYNSYCSRFVNADILYRNNLYSYSHNSPVIRTDHTGCESSVYSMDERQGLYILGQVINTNEFFSHPAFEMSFSYGEIHPNRTLSKADALRINHAVAKATENEALNSFLDTIFYFFPEQVTEFQEKMSSSFEVQAGTYTDYIVGFTVKSKALEGLPIGFLDVKIRVYTSSDSDVQPVEVWGSGCITIWPMVQQCVSRQMIDIDVTPPPVPNSILDLYFYFR